MPVGPSPHGMGKAWGSPLPLWLALQNTGAVSTAGRGMAVSARISHGQGCSQSSTVVAQKWLLLPSSLEVCGHPQVLSTWFGECREPSCSSKGVWIRLFLFKSFFSLLYSLLPAQLGLLWCRIGWMTHFMSRQSEDWSQFVPGYLQTSSRDKGQLQGPRSLSSTFSSELPGLTGSFEESQFQSPQSQVAETEKKRRGFERKRIIFSQEFPNRAGTWELLFQAKGARNKKCPPTGWKKNKKGSCWCESRERKQHAAPGGEGHRSLQGGSLQSTSLPCLEPLHTHFHQWVMGWTTSSHQPPCAPWLLPCPRRCPDPHCTASC